MLFAQEVCLSEGFLFAGGLRILAGSFLLDSSLVVLYLPSLHHGDGSFCPRYPRRWPVLRHVELPSFFGYVGWLLGAVPCDVSCPAATEALAVLGVFRGLPTL